MRIASPTPATRRARPNEIIPAVSKPRLESQEPIRKPVPPHGTEGGRMKELTSRVKVLLHVCSAEKLASLNGILEIDKRRKQVSLLSPEGAITSGVNGPGGNGQEKRQAPRLFAFDALFTEESMEADVTDCMGSEAIKSVVDGRDGCIVSLGSAIRGKEITIFGSRAFNKNGALPLCIHRLFEEINKKKAQGSRFSVRVSAVQLIALSGRESICDLLAPYAKDGDQAPGYFLSGQRGLSEILRNPDSVIEGLAQVRTTEADAACMYLNIAKFTAEADPGSHFVFTLHLYQCTVDGQSRKVVGGRSRLHFIKHGGRSPSISTFGGMLSATLNDQRHLPSRWTKLGTILRECVGSFQCCTVVIIHVSQESEYYAETLASLQLGSRIHRLRKHRGLKFLNMKLRSRSLGKSENHSDSPNQSNGRRTSSDPSSSDQSCDTVIYLGPSADDATDGEHPPQYFPSPLKANQKPPRRPRAATPSLSPPLADNLEGGSSDNNLDTKVLMPAEGPTVKPFRNNGPLLNRPKSQLDQLIPFGNHPSVLTTPPAHSTLITKTQLVRQWIADQNNRNESSSFGSPLKNRLDTSKSINRIYQGNLSYRANNHFFLSSQMHLKCQGLRSRPGNHRVTQGYAADRIQYAEFETSGYQYEIVEVTEPPVPVPTRDVAVQVSPEDIWESCLPPSAQLSHPKPWLNLNSTFASEAIQRYLKCGSLSMSVPSIATDTEGWLESPWDHPLRVLSQECLTVVSTFADSTSVTSETTLQLSPPLQLQLSGNRSACLNY